MTETNQPISHLHVNEPADAVAPDFRTRAQEAGIHLDYLKRHLFAEGWKGLVFEHFEQARSTVRGQQAALVVVDVSAKGGLAFDRDQIEKVFPELVEAYDYLTGGGEALGHVFDSDRDLIVLFASAPLPRYHGKEVKGFLVWRVAGTCHFRQYPAPSDPKAEKRAFGAIGD